MSNVVSPLVQDVLAYGWMRKNVRGMNEEREKKRIYMGVDVGSTKPNPSPMSNPSQI